MKYSFGENILGEGDKQKLILENSQEAVPLKTDCFCSLIAPYVVFRKMMMKKSMAKSMKSMHYLLSELELIELYVSRFSARTVPMHGLFSTEIEKRTFV